MASEMARYGLSVRTIDKNAERTDKSKALVLWPRTLEMMDRMGAGCTQRFIEAGRKVAGANILSGRDEIARIYPTTYEEVGGSHEPVHWRSTLAEALMSLAN
jgi:2-polyprenyl-6-methoxyphenol hydroxylase-like FAD-dependent oxidoreductase